MPSSSVKLIPGVNTDRSPSLNEAGISASNLIRFRGGLVEKRGGWLDLLPAAVAGVPRALWSWRDFSSTDWLAIATTQGLFAVSNGLVQDISPRVLTSVLPQSAFRGARGLSTFGAADPNIPKGIYPVSATFTDFFSVGEAIYSGTYQTTFNVPEYNGLYTSVIPGRSVEPPNIFFVSSYGQNISLSTQSALLPTSFSTEAGSEIVTVALLNNGAPGNQPLNMETPIDIGGITLQGVYRYYKRVIYNPGAGPPYEYPNENLFTFKANQPALRTETVYLSRSTITVEYQLPQAIGGASIGRSLGASDWSLGNYGKLLVACTVGGSIYSWDPSGAFPMAGIISGAPQASGIVISDAAQQIIAYGGAAYTSYDPNYVAWSDTGNPSIWTAAVGNQAGSYRIPTGSGIIGAAAVSSNLILLWTDVDVWAMQYVGYPLIYGFNKLANGCGLLAQFAWAGTGGLTYWMSQNRFWVFDGQSAKPLDCPVYDSVFPMIDQDNAWKIRGASNSGFGEVMWFFPSTGGNGENDSYVCFNPTEGTWDVGTMARSAWVDQSVAGLPIGADPLGNVYQHETSPDAAGQPMAWSFTTGLFQVSEGEDFTFIDRIRPDFKFPNGSGTVQVSVLTYKYPGDAPVVKGPYSFTRATEYISTRCRGRYVALQFSGSDLGSFWRIGRTQFRYAPDGRR